MKILQVISTPPYSWATGGCAVIGYQLSKALVNHRYSVTMVTTDLLDSNNRYKIVKNPECVNGIKIYRFKVVSNILAWKYKLYVSLGMIIFLKNHIKEFDVVHLQDLLSIHAILTALYCKRYNIPYVITTHGSLAWFRKNFLNKFLKIAFFNFVLYNASKIIALNKSEAIESKNVGIRFEKIEIIPNGIDLALYEILPEEGSFREKYGINNNEKIILYLGRLHKTKGIDLILYAFSDLRKVIENVRLIIAGPDDGGYRKSLEKLTKKLNIDNKVLFTGFIDDTEKIAAYTDADVYINPRRDEVFGIVFLESISCGTPVICSENCGIADVIDKNFGFAVSYEKDVLCDAIARLVKDDKLRKRFGKQGKFIVREQYEWNKIVEKYISLYREINKKE